MSHYIEQRAVYEYHHQQSKPLNMDTKLHESSKGSFCIDALLSKSEERANSPDTSRSISPSSSVRSPAISPGSEEVPNPFVPRPGLLGQIYPGSGGFYGYPAQPQSSAFHNFDGAMMHKVQLPVGHHGHSQLQQMQLEWFARTGMFYPRLPDLTGTVPPRALEASLQYLESYHV